MAAVSSDPISGPNSLHGAKELAALEFDRAIGLENPVAEGEDVVGKNPGAQPSANFTAEAALRQLRAAKVCFTALRLLSSSAGNFVGQDLTEIQLRAAARAQMVCAEL